MTQTIAALPYLYPPIRLEVTEWEEQVSFYLTHREVSYVDLWGWTV